MEVAAVLAILQAIPSVLSEFNAVRAAASETDQAKLDAAYATMKAAAEEHVTEAEEALRKAAEE